MKRKQPQFKNEFTKTFILVYLPFKVHPHKIISAIKTKGRSFYAMDKCSLLCVTIIFNLSG